MPSEQDTFIDIKIFSEHFTHDSGMLGDILCEGASRVMLGVCFCFKKRQFSNLLLSSVPQALGSNGDFVINKLQVIKYKFFNNWLR